MEKPWRPEARVKEPLPLMIKLVTPNPLTPLNMPAKPIDELTEIVRALMFAVPAGKPAATVGSHTTGVAVSADVVDHCGVIESHVPLVGADNPLGSQ